MLTVLKRKTVLKILLVAVIICGCAYTAYEAYLDKRDESVSASARELYNGYAAGIPDKKNSTDSSAESENTYADEPTSSLALGTAINPLFSSLRRAFGNPDIVGYLNIPGTSIDYLVVQGSDNDYYLRHDVYRAESQAGWIFMDCAARQPYTSKNTVIYGHNMRDDVMFHSLRKYASKDYFEAHRYITFNTLYMNGTWEVFAFYKTSIDFKYYQNTFDSDEEFMAMVDRMKALSMYDTGVDVSPDDRILTLSTCTSVVKDERHVVSAKLVPAKN
jgi:sortase B